MFASYLGHETHRVRKTIDTCVDEIMTRFRKKCVQASLNGACYTMMKIENNARIFKMINKADTQQIRHIFRAKLSMKLKLCGFDGCSSSVVKKRKKEEFYIQLWGRWDENKKKEATSNVTLKCPICLDDKPLKVSVPCGHLVCDECFQKSNSYACCVCRKDVYCVVPMYQS